MPLISHTGLLLLTSSSTCPVCQCSIKKKKKKNRSMKRPAVVFTEGGTHIFHSGGELWWGQTHCPVTNYLLVWPHACAPLPAGDTAELLCPPEDSASQADLCTRPWLSHQPPLHYGVSAYWLYCWPLRFTATLSTVSTDPPPSLCLSVGAPWPPLALRLCLCWSLLSVDVRPFFFFFPTVSCFMTRESQSR